MEAAEYALMEAVEDRMWWYRAAHAQILAVLARRPGAEGPVLDAGCGTGGVLRRLCEALPERSAPPASFGPAIGLEYAPAAAAAARRKSGAPVVAGDINAMPFAPASFGAAVSLDVLCHAAVRPAEALAELRRVLRPRATLALNLPAFAWLHSAHDRRVHNARRFTARGIAALLREAGFERIETRYWNALLLPLMILQRKVLRGRHDDASDVAPFPPRLDRMLHAVTALERRLMMHGIAFPAGGSVLAVATRP
ncbi:class I SAM-dependent methyltransferase [Roseomonas sp. NAR14]|uniref:Class I SAM-dependent methyltransferase n=1 Tax=Roseomonas acroporae TaxID=2937791 RepID=A0A9X1YAL7_9PROT|nr:class I SAM-dependent methyltransferase [Roseomonas acroporae]MCK8785903.1 class I SAM-dependent methyltransferase [Roseomonas acroporae]